MLESTDNDKKTVLLVGTNFFGPHEDIADTVYKHQLRVTLKEWPDTAEPTLNTIRPIYWL
jgi:hypothetical protein